MPLNSPKIGKCGDQLHRHDVVPVLAVLRG